MGKKVMSLQDNSLKVTKKKNHHESSNKKQLNSLIKVLRPKVYITDSSNFKQLVQELTGNGGGSSSSTIPFPASPGRTEAVTENNIPVIDIIEDDGDKQACTLFDAPVDSFEGFREADKQMYLDDVTFDDIWSTNELGDEWLAYQDLESWLLDTDQPCPNLNGFRQNQEVSIYDYELSALI